MCAKCDYKLYQFLYNLRVFQKVRVGGICHFCNLFRLNKFLHIKFITIISQEGRNVYCLINKKLILKKFILFFFTAIYFANCKSSRHFFLLFKKINLLHVDVSF